MALKGGRSRPFAVVFAVGLLIWGLLAVASVVAQIQINNRFDAWPDRLDWQGWMTILGLAAAVVAVLGVLWGVLGLRSGGALHLGAATLILSSCLTLAWWVIDNTRFHVAWSDLVEGHWRGITWQSVPSGFGIQRWWFFVNDVLLPLALVLLVLWVLVLATGGSSPRSSSLPTGMAYGHVPGQDYRYAAPATPPATFAPGPVVTEPEPLAAPVPLVESEPAAEPAPVPEAAPEPEPVAEPDPASQVSAEPAAHQAAWFVRVQGEDYGPYSRNQLEAYLHEGRLHPGTITHLREGEDRALGDVLA